jgi:hypothetical protein
MIGPCAVDLKKEISEFIKDEILLFGEEQGTRAAFIINDFSTSMCEGYKEKVSEWDTVTVKTCLMKDMAETPGIIRERGRRVVPVICRFLLHLHEHGHLPDAITIVKATRAEEPAFKALVATHEKDADVFARVVLDSFLHQSGAGEGKDTNPYHTPASTMIVTNEDTIRKTMIRLRCDEFCERFSDNTVSECCAHLVTNLASHPASPLLRGDPVLWSAAIVYSSCQRENLIRSRSGGSQLGEEIAFFFDINLSSMRSKASAIKKYLVPTGPRREYRNAV